jgi:UDP-N-acetylglucosamine 2-epimerase (non-hydrolysing)
MEKIKLMISFGTRPEAIKLAPVILRAKNDDRFDTLVVVTAQHRQMLDDILSAFGIKPDFDMNIMAPGQSLFHITSKIFAQMEDVLDWYDPDIVVVQGDTITTFASAVSAFYAGKKVAHIEAGLRTGDKWAPFPEEVNRKIASIVADYHFAATDEAKQNLIAEKIPENRIFVTGNPVIDSLMMMAERVKDSLCPYSELLGVLDKYEKMILITGHRRENFGKPFKQICDSLKELAEQNPETCFVYPVHLNPNVQESVKSTLSKIGNFYLLPPLPYPEFIWFMQKCYFIISDSGGIQEEASALKKPLLLTRKVTERPEVVKAGLVKLVGDDKDKIIEYSQKLLSEKSFYQSMTSGKNPYGDGKSSERILDILASN